MNVSRLRLPASAAVALALLAACTTASPVAGADAPPSPASAGAANRMGAVGPAPADAAPEAADGARDTAGGASSDVRFVACLGLRGVEAHLHDLGFVVVRTEVPMAAAAYLRQSAANTMEALNPAPPADPRDLAELERLGPLTLLFSAHESADGGDWLWVAPLSADTFADDAGRTAWLECLAETPGFTQLTWEDPRFFEEHEPGMLAQQVDAALGFAARARAEGFPWVADPGPESPTTILLPATVTEAELRALLSAVLDADGGWIGFDAAADGGPAFDWRSVVGEFYGAGLG